MTSFTAIQCELKHRVCLSKFMCGIFHFQFRIVFFFYFYFCSTKCMNSLTLKRPNSFQNWNIIKVKYIFTPGLLTFKLQQEVLKFSDICVSWSSPKTELVINFLKPENRIFDNILSQYNFWVNICHSFT